MGAAAVIKRYAKSAPVLSAAAVIVVDASMGLKAVICMAILAKFVCAEFKLTVLHTNDMHGRFEETSKTSGICKAKGPLRDCYGGFARVAHVVREERRKASDGTGPPVVFLNAGDTFTGTPWFSVHKWKIAAAFLNALAPDVISFGNHEFDYGVAGVLPFIEALNCSIIAANMDFAKEPTWTAKINKSQILTVQGHRIGVIGYLTPETKSIAMVGDIKFLDEVESIRKESERLDAEGVKIIIALGHSGYEVDQKIAREVPLVDLVIGGHTNTFLWNGKEPDIEKVEGPYPTMVQQSSGKKVPVIQAYAYTKYIGRLTVVFNDNGDLVSYNGNPLLLNNSIPQEKDVLQILEEFRPEVDARTQKVLGTTRVNLEQSTCRHKECNFGNFVVDAIIANKLSNYAGSYWTDAPIAVINGGSIRTAIDRGQITSGDFIGAMPFDLQIYTVQLKGSHLLQMLETAVRSNGETSRGEFLQVSGLQILYDLKKPKGSRVVDVKTRCGNCLVPKYEPINESKTYTLLVNSYILEGGDGYNVLKEKCFNRKLEELNDINTLIWYVEHNSIVFPEETGRIQFVGDTSGKSDASRSVGGVLIAIFVAVCVLFK